MSFPSQTPGGDTSSDESMWAGSSYAGLVLCCFPAVPLVLFLMKKAESSHIAFHALQAMALGTIVWAVSIVMMIVQTGLAFIGPIGAVISGILSIVQLIFNLGIAVVVIIYAVQAFQGNNPRLPVLGDFLEEKFL